MFPVLPVLILLLLNGPASVERLAADGRLSATIAAIQHRIEAKAESQGRADELVLASLLAMGADPQATQMLARLLWVKESEVEPVDGTPPSDDGSSPPPCPRQAGKPQDGLSTSQRSRDGPSR